MHRKPADRGSDGMDGRSFRRAGALAALAFGAFLPLGTCTSDVAKEFRGAAADGLRAGLESIATGVIEGAYAVYQPSTTGRTNP